MIDQSEIGLADKPPVVTVRALCILVGVIIGCVFAYAYQASLPTVFYEIDGYSISLLYSLVAFFAVPMLAGFVVGLSHPTMAIRNGLIVGLITGIFNSIIASIKFIYAPVLDPGDVYGFSMFAITSVLLWTVLAGLAAGLSSRFHG